MNYKQIAEQEFVEAVEASDAGTVERLPRNCLATFFFRVDDDHEQYGLPIKFVVESENGKSINVNTSKYEGWVIVWLVGKRAVLYDNHDFTLQKVSVLRMEKGMPNSFHQQADIATELAKVYSENLVAYSEVLKAVAHEEIDEEEKRTRRPYACTFPGCDKTFRQASHLTSHKLTHEDLKPFKCKYPGCDAAYNQSNDLTVHVRRHENDKPYVCDFPGCDAKFVCNKNLRSHQVVHIEERDLQCDFPDCGATFVRPECLKAHKLIHDPNRTRSFTCDYPECEAAFYTSDALCKHKKIHTGVRDHVCDFAGCAASFYQSSSLKVHKRIHTGEKNYKCEDLECDAAFSSSSNLASHMKVHTKEGQQERRREEKRIAKLLSEKGIEFKREHRVTFSCTGGTWASVDFVIIFNGRVIMLEIDEQQHFSYGVYCDVARMSRIYEALMLDGNTLPVQFIRYNPDRFLKNNKAPKLPKNHREARLLKVLNSVKDDDWDGMRIQYMYYDTVDNELAIAKDEDFMLQDCCLPPIIT